MFQPTPVATPARSYFPGMGQAVADRTVNRKIKCDDGTTRVETWEEVAYRVALGNALLDPRGNGKADKHAILTREFDRMNHHLRQASLLMSGRHLQHGDETQPSRNQEVFTNCSTAAATFLLFYLLLNGSGVGRAYDDAMIQADLNQMPIVVPVIDWSHKDVGTGEIKGYLTQRDAEHLYRDRKITVYKVPDSREGWAKAIEIIERMAFEGRRDEVLILDFSEVRERGAPIAGMQGRPASGPGPLMGAIVSIARLRDAGLAPWLASLYADHYAAECVLVGGARRAARMATKYWRDRTVFEFIEIKRGGFLWSSNNSVTIDDEFRAAVRKVHELVVLSGFHKIDEETVEFHVESLEEAEVITADEAHAYRVLRKLAHASYFDGTGEPGLINVDRLTQKGDIDDYTDGLFAESAKFQPEAETIPLMQALAKVCAGLRYQMITNPCGEITLLLLGGYCVIADVVPYHAANDDDAEDAFRTAVRALMRTNLMDCLYRREVNRTNRIGVGITGLHEWIYNRFGMNWHDIVDEERSKEMWLTLSRFKRAIDDEAQSFAQELGVTVPHTNTTFKPAGTTSKLFGLTEGAHLPSMREFVRWVQFRYDDPLVKDYAAKGYPIKELKSYSGTTVVGFPTKPTICELDGGDWVVTAAEATPEEQYEFLRLLEKYWIHGVDENGVSLVEETGNQVSYTLKYNPQEVSFERFLETLIEGQFSIRCCSVMPQVDTTAYEYQPEQPVSKEEFMAIVANIQTGEIREEIGFEHIDCGSGGCPVDFNEEADFSDTKVEAEGAPTLQITEMNDPEYRMYGYEGCPWCEKAKNLLLAQGKRFNYIRINDPQLRKEWMDERGFVGNQRTFPKVYELRDEGPYQMPAIFNEYLVGGHDDLCTHFGIDANIEA